MTYKEIDQMIEAWGKDKDPAYIIGYLISLLATLGNRNPAVENALINHFTPDEIEQES